MAMEGAESPCQQLPPAPIFPQHPSQVSIACLPDVVLYSIIASISSLFDRNDVALTCKCFRDLERATRRKLRVRRSANTGPEFLQNLVLSGFRNVTELDLSTFDSDAYVPANRENVSRLLGEGLPNVKSLMVRQESFVVRCAVQAWPCLERLEVQECPKGTEDPFWVDLDWVDVLGKLERLEELSFVPRPQAKKIREPFEGFIVSLGQSPRQYPSLSALRSCFFATDKVLSVLGKAMPNLACLELINDMLDIYYSGYKSLTKAGIEHLSNDYPLLTELRISGDVCPDKALQSKGIWLDSIGTTALLAFCQSQLSSLCLEGPVNLQLGLMVDQLVSSRQKRLHLGWLSEKSKNLEKLNSVTNLTDVSLGYSVKDEVDFGRLRELVLANKALRQLELVLPQGATTGILGFVATHARSLLSFTCDSVEPGATILEVVSKLSPARMQLQTLKLRLRSVGVAGGSRESWPALENLSLEFLDLRDEESNLGCWLQNCSNLTSLKYQCIASPSGKCAALSSLVNLQSLMHLEVGATVTTRCIEQIMVLTQLRSIVLFDTFKRPLMKIGALCNHPNLQSIALKCTIAFKNFSQYSDYVETLKVAPLLEPLLGSKSLQQVKSNFDISDLSSEFKRRLYVAP